jgi:octaprenyl-diphosphate synthase
LTNISLSEISVPIEKELDEFVVLFRNSLKSKVGLLDIVTRFILKQKGKKIRPLLVLLSSQACGSVTERTYRGAILVELLHTATLVHDDVVDGAESRRGFPSINAIWKNKIAVLMGDYLLAKGLMLAVDSKDYDFLQVITNTVKRMSEGELLQISKTRKLDNDEETYFRIISDKTASLLSTCCSIGAMAATKNDEIIKALHEYGENIGLAFQIRDDLLDIVGSKSLIGKPLGSDIKEKKLTLPLIYALRTAPKADSKKIISELKRSEKKINVSMIVDFILNNHGVDYAEKKAIEIIKRAKNNLSILPDSEAKRSLLLLSDYIIERKK